MSNCSVNPRCPACNQSSLSAHAVFQLSERVDQLEEASVLLAKAEALTGVASGDALDECDQFHRHYYLATLDDQIVAARGLIDDVLAAIRRGDFDR